MTESDSTAAAIEALGDKVVTAAEALRAQLENVEGAINGVWTTLEAMKHHVEQLAEGKEA